MRDYVELLLQCKNTEDVKECLRKYKIPYSDILEVKEYNLNRYRVVRQCVLSSIIMDESKLFCDRLDKWKEMRWILPY